MMAAKYTPNTTTETSGTNNTESGGARIGPYSSTGGHGIGTTATVPGTEGQDQLYRPYTSYGDTTFPSESEGDGMKNGEWNPDGSDGPSTNFPWQSDNRNPKQNNTGRPTPLSGGTVPDMFDLSNTSTADLQYTSGFDHKDDVGNDAKGQNSDPQVPVPNPNVINRGYLDNGQAAMLTTRNKAAIRQQLGNRTDGNNNKAQSSPQVGP